jgi:hypothetical protein
MMVISDEMGRIWDEDITKFLEPSLYSAINTVIFPSGLLPEAPSSNTYKLSSTLQSYAAIHFISSDISSSSSNNRQQ